MIVRVAPPEHYAWIAERARLAIVPGFQAIEAIRDDGRIVGMIGFDGWAPNSVCMHDAIDHHAAGRHLIKPAFRIAFMECDRGVVLGYVLSSNPRALALDLHLGFREVARLRDAWSPGVDIHVLEMRREECRWLSDQPLRRVA